MDTQQFDRAMGLQDSGDERLLRAIALSESGDDEGALRVVEDIRKGTQDPDRLAVLAVGETRFLIQLGRFAEAEKRLDEVEAGCHTPWLRARIALGRALVYWNTGKWNGSLEILERVAEDYPGVLHSVEHRDVYEAVRWR